MRVRPPRCRPRPHRPLRCSPDRERSQPWPTPAPVVGSPRCRAVLRGEGRRGWSGRESTTRVPPASSRQLLMLMCSTSAAGAVAAHSHAVLRHWSHRRPLRWQPHVPLQPQLPAIALSGRSTRATPACARPMERVVRHPSFSGLLKLRNDLDHPDDVTVEFSEFLGRNPKLLMQSSTNGSRRVATEKRAIDSEASDVARAALLDIPISSDLRRVLLVENWIEDRLLGQAWRERLPARCRDQSEFLRADRTIERYGAHDAGRSRSPGAAHDRTRGRRLQADVRWFISRAVGCSRPHRNGHLIWQSSHRG